MNRTLAMLGMALAALTAGAGCGDDDGGGGYSSGLPPDEQVSDVSDEDLRMACQEFADSLEGALTGPRAERAGCTIDAFESLVQGGQAPTREACEEEVDRCLQEGGSSGGGPDVGVDCDAPGANDELSMCDATVRDLEGCLNAVISESSSILSQITCATLTDPEQAQEFVERAEQDPFDQPACETINAMCPDAFGGEDAFEGSSSSGGGGTNPNSGPTPENGCSDTCSDANDGFCDDGGPGADFPICALGTDCGDCGPR